MEYKGEAVEKEVEKEVEGEKQQSQQVFLVKYVLQSHKKKSENWFFEEKS